MSTAFIFGATGHIGSYLVPMMVREGYEVYAVSRGGRKAYSKDVPEWDKVNTITCSRSEAIETAAKTHPDVICDMLCYNGDDAKELVDGLRAVDGNENVRIIEIGSIWIYGDKYEAPVTEEHPRNAQDSYGRGKIEMEKYFLEEHKRSGLRVTVLHPGHISGSGWAPVGPQGNRDLQVLRDVIAGKQIILPERGQATLLHVHAEDIARLTMTCIENDASIGESFHITAPASLTVLGYAERLYRHFGHEPNIKFVSYQEFLSSLSDKNARMSAEHLDRSPVCSMDKARRMLDFEPKHSAIDTVIEAIESIKNEL